MMINCRFYITHFIDCSHHDISVLSLYSLYYHHVLYQHGSLGPSSSSHHHIDMKRRGAGYGVRKYFRTRAPTSITYSVQNPAGGRGSKMSTLLLSCTPSHQHEQVACLIIIIAQPSLNYMYIPHPTPTPRTYIQLEQVSLVPFDSPFLGLCCLALPCAVWLLAFPPARPESYLLSAV